MGPGLSGLIGRFSGDNPGVVWGLSGISPTGVVGATRRAGLLKLLSEAVCRHEVDAYGVMVRERERERDGVLVCGAR